MPDATPSPPESLPAAALAFLSPDSVRTTRLGSGVVYRYVWSGRGPWALHLVQADLAGHCELELATLRAREREHGNLGRERVSSMVARSTERIVAAVNADFFTAEGAAVGTEVDDGVVLSVAPRPAVAWRPDRTAPWIGTADLESDSLLVGWTVSVDGGDGSTEAVGGFPELLDAGHRVGDLEVAARPSFAAARHPRTAIGFDPSSGWAWLVVVDGRQAPYSDGMTLPELAELFEALGAVEALNLDGGGSTVMVVGGVPVNRPSDVTGERPVVNGLALVRNPDGCAVSAPR